MIRRLGRWLVLASALAVPVTASADVLHLKPRGQVEGTIVDEDGKFYVVELPAGGRTRVEKDKVESIERSAAPRGPKTTNTSATTPKPGGAEHSGGAPRTDAPRNAPNERAAEAKAFAPPANAPYLIDPS